MPADARQEVSAMLAELEASQRRAEQARADYTAAWRRLRSVRDALAREIDDRLAPSRRETDPDAIFAVLRDGYAARIASARADAARAAQARDAARRSSGVMGWLPRRRAELEAAAGEAASKRDYADFLESELPHKLAEFRRLAAAKARSNAAANEADARPLAPLRERLNGLTLALDALERGDDKVIACLMRWDLDALCKVATVWKRIREYGRVGEADMEYYHAAGRTSLAAPPPPGAPVRPTVAAGDEGDVVRMSVMSDGTVVGTAKRPYHGIPAGANLASVPTMQLAEALGALRVDGLDADADLLEAFLDAAAADWREQVAAAVQEAQRARDPVGEAPAPGAEDPYDVLGVRRGMPLAEIKAAFMAVMQAVEHLPNAAGPQRRLIAAFKAVKELETRAGHGPA